MPKAHGKARFSALMSEDQVAGRIRHASDQLLQTLHPLYTSHAYPVSIYICHTTRIHGVNAAALLYGYAESECVGQRTLVVRGHGSSRCISAALSSAALPADGTPFEVYASLAGNRSVAVVFITTCTPVGDRHVQPGQGARQGEASRL